MNFKRANTEKEFKKDLFTQYKLEIVKYKYFSMYILFKDNKGVDSFTTDPDRLDRREFKNYIQFLKYNGLSKKNSNLKIEKWIKDKLVYLNQNDELSDIYNRRKRK